MLILSECSFINNVTTHKYISYYIECSDISDTSDLCHSGGYEDDFLANDSNVKPNDIPGRIELLPELDVNLENCFILFIWQPPKFS